jgi:hypothetical protein
MKFVSLIGACRNKKLVGYFGNTGPNLTVSAVTGENTVIGQVGKWVRQFFSTALTAIGH